MEVYMAEKSDVQVSTQFGRTFDLIVEVGLGAIVALVGAVERSRPDAVSDLLVGSMLVIIGLVTLGFGLGKYAGRNEYRTN